MPSCVVEPTFSSRAVPQRFPLDVAFQGRQRRCHSRSLNKRTRAVGARSRVRCAAPSVGHHACGGLVATARAAAACDFRLQDAECGSGQLWEMSSNLESHPNRISAAVKKTRDSMQDSPLNASSGHPRGPTFETRGLVCRFGSLRRASAISGFGCDPAAATLNADFKPLGGAALRFCSGRSRMRVQALVSIH